VATEMASRWARRCGEECAANWSASVGQALGVTLR
jgi:hypothetical protein